jgi:hypothetical protein
MWSTSYPHRYPCARYIGKGNVSVAAPAPSAAIERLPEAAQDQLAAAIERTLEKPAVSSDTIRPDVVAALTDVIAHSEAVLDYLKDR